MFEGFGDGETLTGISFNQAANEISKFGAELRGERKTFAGEDVHQSGTGIVAKERETSGHKGENNDAHAERIDVISIVNLAAQDLRRCIMQRAAVFF